MKTVDAEVCVIGAGAGGTGVVYRLIRNGIKTVVVDKNPDFGGTAVFSGVDGWEPGVSLDGIHIQLKDELEKMDKACHVTEVVPNCNIFNPENKYNWENHSFAERPWGLSLPTGKKYEDTLYRCSSLRKNRSFKRFQFEPEAMIKAINNVLSPYADNLTRFFGYWFKDCIVHNRRVISVIISNQDGDIKINAKYFVDSSGEIILARKAGCGYSFGADGFEKYNEPGAGEKNNSVNAVSYVFRIEPVEEKNYTDIVPEEYRHADISAWKEERMKNTVSCFTAYPNGDINVNMLPTMEGNEYFMLGKDADFIGRARVYAYWNYLQNEKRMKGYRLKHIFDAGIRESYRLDGKYILTENDIRRGLNNENFLQKTAAIADHALDVHGEGHMCKELDEPYIIPIECSVTNEFDNLFVACRGASFSHVASSSIRLTRTMLSFGESVGEYISDLSALSE